MFENIIFPRTPEFIKSQIQPLVDAKQDFEIQHGTYTTKLIKPTGKMVFSNVRFRPKVFVAANMVKRDTTQSEFGQHILSQVHHKRNYANTQRAESFTAERVYNIDIKGAYGNCLYNSGLITEGTYNYLMSLKKDERLPSVGMLARSHVKYHYQEGTCVDVETYRAPTAELFFYLIAEIDRIMREIQWILGNDFLFYWVDGVFFKDGTPAKKVSEVERYLTDLGYHYSYELCNDFFFENVEGQCRILMQKNAELKEWRFRDSNERDREISKMLHEIYENNA